MSETAISTYKHIGRIRSARLVGIDLAKFYLQLGQVSPSLLWYFCTAVLDDLRVALLGLDCQANGNLTQVKLLFHDL